MKIIFYTKENSEVPVLDFLRSLSPKLRQKNARQIEFLGEIGFEAKEPTTKKISIVLTNGFLKKTNKTPTSEIEKARRYQQDYRARNAKERK